MPIFLVPIIFYIFFSLEEHVRGYNLKEPLVKIYQYLVLDSWYFPYIGNTPINMFPILVFLAPTVSTIGYVVFISITEKLTTFWYVVFILMTGHSPHPIA